MVNLVNTCFLRIFFPHSNCVKYYLNSAQKFQVIILKFKCYFTHCNSLKTVPNYQEIKSKFQTDPAVIGCNSVSIVEQLVRNYYVINRL